MMNTLIVTVGLPRSGKSTWAKVQQIPIVNRDSIRLALHGNVFIDIAEPMVTAIEDIMVRSLFLAGHNKIIIDSTCISTRRRNRWIEFANKNNYTLKFRVFDVPKEVCIERAKLSNREDLIPVIEHMYTVIINEPFNEDIDLINSSI